MAISKQVKRITVLLFLLVCAVFLFLFFSQAWQAIQPLRRMAEEAPKNLARDEVLQGEGTDGEAVQVARLEEWIIGIDSHIKLVDKLNAGFVFQDRNDRQVRLPEEFFALKQGNQLDFAVFIAFVLRDRGLGEVAVFRYRYIINQGAERIGSAVVFRGHDLPPKYISLSKESAEAIAYGWSLEELLRIEEQRIGATITHHRTFLLWPLPDAESLWPEEWDKR